MFNIPFDDNISDRFNSKPIEERGEIIIYELQSAVRQHLRELSRLKENYERERVYINDLIKRKSLEIKRNWKEATPTTETKG